MIQTFVTQFIHTLHNSFTHYMIQTFVTQFINTLLIAFTPIEHYSNILYTIQSTYFTQFNHTLHRFFTLYLLHLHLLNAIQTYLHNSYGKCSKISNSFLFLFSNKMRVIKAVIHKILEGRAVFRSSLTWVCAICFGFFFCR